MGGKPITAFALTALILWAVYLWRQGRLGKPGLLPHPPTTPRLIGPPAPTAGPPVPPSLLPGWQPVGPGGPRIMP